MTAMNRNNSMVIDDAGARLISTRRASDDELAIFGNLAGQAGAVAAQIVFGGRQFYEGARATMGGAEWPLLWLQGDVCPGRHIAGAQTLFLEGKDLRRLTQGGRVVGSAWSDEDADYCLLAGVLPTDLKAEHGRQTTSCFENIEAILADVGMDFSHVARTWLYLDRLLSWYDSFNVARTAFFEARGVFEGLVPASTGIGAANPFGAALTAGALAIRPKHPGVRIEEVGSPLQCPAVDYRSSFSRAVELAFPDRRLLMVSGTASIAPGGESMFADDVEKQIHLTLDVVEAILASRGMDWKDTTRAIGYFHDIADLRVFDACCQSRGIAPLPMAPAHATVCRSDLLFEIELDAAVAS
jgi:enamine deaminase RidA (YjgF/YER057c/UK114 family)